VANYAWSVQADHWQEIAALTPATETLRPELVCDENQGRYHPGEIGWDENRRIDTILIHIDILDGKVWLQYNGTDLRIAEELVPAGIPRDHIVLGFQPPQFRKYTDYAAA
jgi:hypothetical protein